VGASPPLLGLHGLTNPPRGKGRVFHTLDGLRGVAAVFVAMRHTVFFHGLSGYGSFMAVDLFFVLSGFVIAHAYQDRLAEGLTVERFLALRYLRLWPVYLVGAVVSLVAAGLQLRPELGNLTPAQIVQSIPLTLVMLPGPIVSASVYPVEGVAWSLALELIANFAYGLWWRQLRRPMILAAALGVSAVTLIISTLYYGGLDVGFTWANALGGLPRVAVSFVAGVAICRLLGAKSWRLPVWPWAPLLALPVLLWAKIDPIIYPLICVLVFFPVLIFVAASSEPGPRSARVFAWLGLVSYPLYSLHRPVAELVAHVLPTALLQTHWGDLFGAPYMLVLLALCGLVERYYDRPVRRALSRWFEQALDRFRRESAGSSVLDLPPT
jgi:peptidoglycan/LPS O-acetylase OafA/YrhL